MWYSCPLNFYKSGTICTIIITAITADALMNQQNALAEAAKNTMIAASFFTKERNPKTLWL